MRVSRAQFLAACSAAVVGSTFDAAASTSLPDLVFDISVAGPRLQDFSALIGTPFRLAATTDAAGQALVLARVHDRGRDQRFEQFSILFQGDAATRIEDGIHELHHASLGRLDLFIASIGATTSGQVTYEACFSRLIDRS